jgi:replicative DNA helicase
MAATGTVGLFFSLEMGSVSIADRALADMTFDDREPIEYERIGRGLISDREAERLIDARRAFKDLPLKIDEQPNLSFAQIASRARKWAQRLERKGKRLGIVWVDHMHIVRPSDRYRGNRTAEVSETSAALKALAKELDIPVVALAQLSREVERSDDKRPQLFHLRDSGSIEQDADLICFVFREAYYVKDALTEAADDYTHIAHLEEVRNLLEVIVAKHRNGPTGIVRLFCNIECNAIRNAAPSSFDRAPARAGRAT